MKKTYILVILFFFICASAFPQSAYLDALQLKKYIDPAHPTKFVTEKKQVSEYCQIINKYYNNKFATEEDLLNDLSDANRPDYNPYIGPYLTGGGVVSNTTHAISSAFSMGVSALGNADVTNFTDALARFLIKRGKEELDVAFFSKLQNFIAANPEATILFPKTSNVLGKIEITRYAELIQTIRKSFDEDLKGIPNNAYKLLESPKYAELNKKYPELGVVLKTAHTLANTDPSKNPVAFVNDFTTYTEWSEMNPNLGSSFQTLNLISNSLVDETGMEWISYQQLNTLYRDQDGFKLYLGLIRAQAEVADIRFSVVGGKTVLLKGFIDSTGNMLIKKVLDDFVSLSEQTKQLAKDIGNSKADVNNDVIYSYLTKTVEIATYGVSIANKINPGCIDDKYMDYTSKGIEIYRYAYTKDYSSAVFSLYALLKDVTNDPDFKNVKASINAEISKIEATMKKGTAPAPADVATLKNLKEQKENVSNLPNFIEKFLTFGNFISGIAKAQSPEEIESVIEASALPAGSSRTKKHADWSIDLNAFVGYYYGAPRKSTDGLFTINQGITAPVGLAFNRGLHSFGSISVFASIIDIGAIVDYRISHDSTSIDQTIHLENILSPGISLAYGLPWNIPLTISGGWQYGPNLLKVESNQLTLTDNPVWRWYVSATIDIPLAHLGSSVNRKTHHLK
ncbi:MAG: hypothetical protein JWP12_93 [Bacteroidetes bacterium]|nr:hypothetical protein [Bacteroidota bacterium]